MSEMRDRVAFLEEELRRKDAILLNMTEAMKALNPPPNTSSPETRGSSQTASEEPSDTPPLHPWKRSGAPSGVGSLAYREPGTGGAQPLNRRREGSRPRSPYVPAFPRP
jgi:hypothetical protein